MYTRIGEILQECGRLLGGCLTVKNYWGLLTGDDGKTKKKKGENDEYMSHKVSYKWIRKTQVIPEYVVFYNVWGF